MGIKNFLGLGGDKGIDCTDDSQTGNKICRVMIRHKNNKYSTGSEFSGGMDSQCKFHPNGRWSVFDDDEDIVKKTIRQAEADCRGGIN